jgi:hypothetical protein
MTTDAQTAANISNAQASSGPRTQVGKDNSSRNAITLGLFTIHDFVRPAERDEYSQLVSALSAQLNPNGALEDAFAAAIVGAVWRLRRCSLLEARMSETCELDPMLDPMEDDSAARPQLSVDRARAQSHNILRRSIAELRRLQTQRNIRLELFSAAESPDPDLTSYSDVATFLNNHERGKLLARKLDGLDTFAAIAGTGPGRPLPASYPPPPAEAPGTALGSFCKPADRPASGTPRNAPCPCGSGVKHKRCCGKSAPPVLAHAA